jgi:uncharacterized damage-inducible protein DinB
MREIISAQYAFVKESRGILLDYCGSLSQNDFIRENSSFGRGSIRNLLVHICNTYEFWVGRNLLSQRNEFTVSGSVSTVAEVKEAFINVDFFVSEFVLTFENKYMDDINIKRKERDLVTSPYKVFSHVITHEFHHKGQILSLSRHLGYVPVDTDIIR